MSLPLSIVLAVATATSAPALTLEQAVSTALEKQPDVRSAHADTEAARARVDQARAPLLPEVNASAGYSRSTANFAGRPGSLPNGFTRAASSSWDSFNYYNFGLNVNQLIWDFGATSKRWSAAEATAGAQEETAKATGLEVAFNVRTAFFNARAAKDLLRVARETLDNQKKHYEQVSAFVSVGNRPEIDLAQAKTDLANARVQLINAENAYDLGRAQLNRAMGVSGPIDYEIADQTIASVDGESGSIEGLLSEAEKTRPELRAIGEQIKAEALTRRAIQGSYGPALGVSGSVSEAGGALSDLSWNWSAGVTLSWNIFQGGATRAQVAEADAVLVKLNAQLDAARDQLRLDITQASLAVRASLAAITAAEEAAGAAKDRLTLAEGRYETGVGSVIELGDAQLAESSARAQQVQADYRLASARAQLLRALGRT